MPLVTTKMLELRFLGSNQAIKTTEMILLPLNMFQENEKSGAYSWDLNNTITSRVIIYVNIRRRAMDLSGFQEPSLLA